MIGPPPPEVAPRFKVLKNCVIALVVALGFKILFYVVTNHEMRIFTSSLNMILNIVVGIYLFNDDPDFKPVYDFMQRTCCQGCQDQCPYGTGCLMTFVLVNGIDLVLTLLFIVAVSPHLRASLQPTDSSGSDSEYVGGILYIASAAITIITQVIIVYQGMKAHQEILQSGVSALVGDYDRHDPLERAGGSSATRSNWGAGSWGGGGSSANRDRDRDDDREGAPASTGAGNNRNAQSFEVFGGQGHRLGD